MLVPGPQGLVQVIREKGVPRNRRSPAVGIQSLHENASGRGEGPGDEPIQVAVKKIGIDLHFSYANLLCDVAWARAHGTNIFVIPEAPERKVTDGVGPPVNMPGAGACRRDDGRGAAGRRADILRVRCLRQGDVHSGAEHHRPFTGSGMPILYPGGGNLLMRGIITSGRDYRHQSCDRTPGQAAQAARQHYRGRLGRGAPNER
jgi:hypothetical protein